MLKNKIGKMDNTNNILVVVLLAVTMIIGLSIFPVVADSVEEASNDPNITPTMDTLLKLVPLFYIFLLLAIVFFEVFLLFDTTKGFK